MRALLAFLGILFIAHLSSCRYHDASAGRTTSDRARKPRALIDEITEPVPLDFAAERSVKESVRAGVVLSKVPAAPSVGQPRPALAERPDVEIGAEPLHALFGHRLLDDVEPKKGDTKERLIRTEPVLALAADGTAALSFETLQPVVGASAYIGHRVPEDPLGLPRFRRRSTVLEGPVNGPTGHRYTVNLDVKGLLRKKYDVGRILQRKAGVVVWRLELLDGRMGTSRIFDGETAFRCDPCQGKTAAFVQLPSVRLGPFVDRVHSDKATISFSTDAATAAWVAVFDDRRKVQLVASSSSGTVHEVSLNDLEPGTRYRYQPVILDARSEVHIHRGATFRTEPQGLTRFEFVALSDSRSGFGPADEQYGGTNARVLRDLLEVVMAQGRPSAIIFVGDLIDGYTTWPGSFSFQLEMWKRTVQPFHAYIPIYEVMGNHEALLDIWTNGWAADKPSPSAEEIFAAQFVNPPGAPKAVKGAPIYSENTYSVDIGTAHLSVVNSNYWYRSHPERSDHPMGTAGNREGWLDDATLDWLDKDLSAARKAGQKHLFVFTHEPGFPNGGHAKDGLYWSGKVPKVLLQRAKLYAILGRHGVAAIVHGDEHNYSRILIDSEILGAPVSRPVWHLVTGGAGAPFYAQDKTVPWSKKVAAFDARQHYLRFMVDGDDCYVEAISREGGLIDRFNAAVPRK